LVVLVVDVGVLALLALLGFYGEVCEALFLGLFLGSVFGGLLTGGLFTGPVGG